MAVFLIGHQNAPHRVVGFVEVAFRSLDEGDLPENLHQRAVRILFRGIFVVGIFAADDRCDELVPVVGLNIVSLLGVVSDRFGVETIGRIRKFDGRILHTGFNQFDDEHAFVFRLEGANRRFCEGRFILIRFVGVFLEYFEIVVVRNIFENAVHLVQQAELAGQASQHRWFELIPLVKGVDEFDVLVHLFP